ncbi:hypothetical protein [Flammeovirga kamogawensis]|uniref:Lipocalin-like domain-containing protein n=1 Tax=Flammeovirga kamogawensis TaxID=373891 RepID=A0ABX8GVF7_9BACT|nr:hypothetical protein [Flammeovirga kamogawensis]MBB6461681.1 hypothetical protein [Flammeovirga kamogawensis]QWG07394.1 hypothetical protein KM029_00175 [Flammeovirga kamogawensis]TRX69207.1 hypothetical protein EO216_14125 [Flammeovirga kamogawensis]
MKNFRHLILSLLITSLFAACTQEDTINPDTPTPYISTTEPFDATWEISSTGEISSIAFTSEGLATVQGVNSSNARNLVEEKDLLFYGNYEIESDTIIDLEGYGTIKVLNNDGSIEIELIKEDNPEEKISMTGSLVTETFSDKTLILTNIWKDEDEFFAYFTKDGSLITSEGIGIWEWLDNSEERLKVKLDDDIIELIVIELTEEEFTFSMEFTEEGVTETDTIVMIRSEYEDFMNVIDEETTEPGVNITGKGSISINGEEIFTINGAAGQQHETFLTDSSGRFFDIVFLEDVSVIKELEEYDGEEFLTNMLHINLSTSATSPKRLEGNYSKGADWSDVDNGNTAPDYAINFAGISTQVNGSTSFYAKNHEDEGLNIQSFTITENDDKTFTIDASFDINKINEDSDQAGEKVSVDFHYEGKIFFITD